MELPANDMKAEVHRFGILLHLHNFFLNVRRASGRFGVRIPAATDLSRKKTGDDSSTAKRSAIGVSVTGLRR